jgi:flagellar hook-basal body complex protein FliE
MNYYILLMLLLFIYIILFIRPFTEGFTKKIEKGVKKTTKSAKKTTKSASKDVEKAAKSASKDVEKAAKSASKDVENVAKNVEKGITSLDPTKAIRDLEKMIKDIGRSLNSLGSSVKTISKEFNQLNNRVNNSFNEIKKVSEDLPKQIDNQVIGKFTSFFTQLGDILNNGIIKPMEALFIGLGNIFVEIFNIFKLIGNKIVSLPGCIFYYIFDGIFAAIYGIFTLLLPRFIIKWIIDPIVSVFSFFLDWFGYTWASRRCRSFKVNEEVRKMNNQLLKINKSFNKDFGNLDFSKIKL